MEASGQDRKWNCVTVLYTHRHVVRAANFSDVIRRTKNESDQLMQRRRLKTEEKAKVVAAVWGKTIFKLLAALAIVH